MVNVTRKILLPEFQNSTYEGYAIKFLHANFWKFSRTIGDWEDAVAEAAYCFYDCRRRYGAKVENEKHFMALYKRSMSSWFIDWANWQTNSCGAEAVYCKVQPEVTLGFEGDLSLKLQDASSELKQVLKIVLEAPAEVLTILKKEAKDGLDLFFTKAVKYCGLAEEKAPILEEELRELLN